MKLITLLLMLYISLFAKSSNACYSIEIYKDKYNSKNVDLVSQLKYPESCQQMKLGSSLAIRCGCYESKDEISKHIKSFKKKYNKSKITLTYSYRFDGKEKRILPVANRGTCYSVELTKRKNNLKSINELSAKNYPKNCVLMSIRDLVAIRCGCYDTKKEVIENYYKLKKSYKNARIRQSYVSKFNGDDD